MEPPVAYVSAWGCKSVLVSSSPKLHSANCYLAARNQQQLLVTTTFILHQTGESPTSHQSEYANINIFPDESVLQVQVLYCLLDRKLKNINNNNYCL